MKERKWGARSVFSKVFARKLGRGELGNGNEPSKLSAGGTPPTGSSMRSSKGIRSQVAGLVSGVFTEALPYGQSLRAIGYSPLRLSGSGSLGCRKGIDLSQNSGIRRMRKNRWDQER